MKNENFLLTLNSRGIFPGPWESREHFLKRANTLQNLAAPVSLSLTKEIFNSSPDWVDIRFEKKGLLPWEGAATWIEENEEGVPIASIQIKPFLPASLYPQSEVIAHELVHAMRLMFEEKRFEEILAYQTSKNRFRRYFGPLFTQPSEAKAFILSLLASWSLYWVEAIFDFSFGAVYFLLFPFVILVWSLFRLVRSQTVFFRALHRIEKAVKKPHSSLAIALRLSDQEIELFSKSSPKEIRAFAAKEKGASMRWTQLFSAYFSP